MTSNINLVSLTSAQGFKITGINQGDKTGWSVNKAGDVNGDGLADVVISAPNANSNAGMTYVIFGRVGGYGSINLGNLSSAQGFSISGDVAGIQSGFAVASGDVNGDGFGDIALSAPGGSANYIYVVYGSQQPSDVYLSVLDSSQGFTLSFSSNSYQSLSVGDVNKDGFDDLLFSYYNGNPDYDYCVVFYGHAVNTNYFNMNIRGYNPDNVMSSNYGLNFKGIYSYGSYVTAGDINGDGYDDVLFGVFGEGDGSVNIVFGNQTKYINSDESYLQISGASGTSEYAGYSIASSDLNNDGIGDLIIGAPSLNSNAGAAYVVYGKSSGWSALNLGNIVVNQGFTIVNSVGGDRFGVSVRGGSDVNGDSIEDMIISACNANSNAGAAYVIYGHTGTSSNVLISNLKSTQGFAIKGEGSNNYLGYSSAFVGDFNGDGVGDILVGAFGYGSNTGAAYLIYGDNNGITKKPSAAPTRIPSIEPSAAPILPTISPSYAPSLNPTSSPTDVPSKLPTMAPTTPTSQPSFEPTGVPSFKPTIMPSSPSSAPSYDPTTGPTSAPTAPTFEPSLVPSFVPSLTPTKYPSAEPTIKPSFDPSSNPSIAPSKVPTYEPTNLPTAIPSLTPSFKPSLSPTPYYKDVYITGGGNYVGTGARTHYIIASSTNTIITGGEGSDKFTFSTFPGVITTITDFDVTMELIDLSAFTTIHGMGDFTITQGSNSAIINLPGDQEIMLIGVPPISVVKGDFIFANTMTSSPTTISSSSFSFSESIIGYISGGGAFGLGSIYGLSTLTCLRYTLEYNNDLLAKTLKGMEDDVKFTYGKGGFCNMLKTFSCGLSFMDKYDAEKIANGVMKIYNDPKYTQDDLKYSNVKNFLQDGDQKKFFGSPYVDGPSADQLKPAIHAYLSRSNPIHDNTFTYNAKSKAINPQSTIASFVTDIQYSNPLLNIPNLINDVYKIGGVIAVNNLIELGRDEALANSLVESIEEHGTARVASAIFASPLAQSMGAGVIKYAINEVASSIIADQKEQIVANPDQYCLTSIMANTMQPIATCAISNLIFPDVNCVVSSYELAIKATIGAIDCYTSYRAVDSTQESYDSTIDEIGSASIISGE